MAGDENVIGLSLVDAKHLSVCFLLPPKDRCNQDPFPSMYFRTSLLEYREDVILNAKFAMIFRNICDVLDLPSHEEEKRKKKAQSSSPRNRGGL